jgi:hypothetical protein
MLITINILSAMSIVMALFIPYFILLHLNNKLRKEVEGALNRVLEVKQFTENLASDFFDFKQFSQLNFDLQDKNWDIYRDHISSFKGAIREISKNIDDMNENTSIIEEQIADFYIRLSQKQTLKKILENPIEVKKQACETKVDLMGKDNENDTKTTAEIVNKVDFKHNHGSFKKGDIFVLNEDNLKVYRDKILVYDYYSWTTFGKNVMKKLLKFNELNEN